HRVGVVPRGQGRGGRVRGVAHRARIVVRYHGGRTSVARSSRPHARHAHDDGTARPAERAWPRHPTIGCRPRGAYDRDREAPGSGPRRARRRSRVPERDRGTPVTTTDATPDVDADATTVAASVHADNTTFADFGVRQEIVDALSDAGIVQPFPIQAMTLPVAKPGHDIIVQANTGTGKPLGFGVPLLHRVVAPGEPGFDELPAPGKPQALVVVPTRELAVQVANDLTTASKRRSVRIVQLYGGRAYEPQVEALQRGVEVVVGTPGR